MRQERIYTGVKNMSTVTEQLLTRKQIAALFQVSPLPAIRLGAGSVRYRKSDVERFVTESITPKAQA